MKKVVSLFLCLAMLFSMLVTTTMAEGSYNATMETNETEVEAGETFTVTIKNKAMTVSSFTCGIFFDTSKLECMSIVGTNPNLPDRFYLVDIYEEKSRSDGTPTPAESNVTGTVGFGWAGGENTEYVAGTIATITFKVKEDATGSANILLFEDSAGTNGAKIGNDYQTYEQAKDDNTLDKDVVTIVAPTVPATGVTLNTNALSLDINGTATLVATVQPDGASNKAVTFVSSAPDVVQVVNAATGEIKGLKEGSATITVTTADGGFTAKCEVTVACKHTNKSVVEAQDSDCKTQGWDEHKKCDVCGQLFKADGTTEISEKPFRPLSQQHTGGTATCTAKAICDICGQPYGDFAAHSYTAETKKAEALKSEGNCRDFAVYYYSCSVCGEVEGNDNHTFTGDKDATKHVGGTETVNASAADHKNQVDGYTGDTKCLGCNEIIAYGTSIPAVAHVESLTWTTDGTEHWKVCSVDVNGSPCGVEIDGTRATHYSNKAENKATCNAPAKCDACGVEYGQKLNHVPANTWSKDASGHWHECQNGCGEKLDFAAHTPDKEGGATEEYAIKCKFCDYVIEPMLNHEHKFDVKNATDNYKATDATCMKPATYYWACRCGEKSSDTYEYGEKNPDAHNWDSAWSGADNPDNHWHACLNGCGEKNDVTVHDYKMKSDSTKHWEECVCGRKINEGNHIDTDKNYKCDTCGHDMLRPGPSHFGHWDYNGDGRCDYCGAKTNCTHTDANGDGKCDNCSSSMSGDKTESAQTFDAGILMYAGMAVLAATGSAAMIGKKRKEQ